MALPTVAYHATAAATNASTVQAVATRLHDMLIDAGWTLEWADSDAIGGGSSSDPAWDKTYSSGALAGTVVYRMPANGHTTRWFVKFTLGWGSAADRVAVRFAQCGTGHDGTGGITGGGSGITIAAGSGSTRDLGHLHSVSEDGFAIWWDGNSTSAALLAIERLRLADGTVTDDMLIHAKTNNASSSFNRRTYSANTGEDTVSDAIVLGRINDSGTFTTITAVSSLATGDGTATAVVGPYMTRGDILSSPPRHWCLIPFGDAAAGTTISVVVDGTEKPHQLSASSMSTGYVAIAME